MTSLADAGKILIEMRKKNPAAVELAKLRMKKMTAEERSEVALLGGEARARKLTPEQRSEIARKAGKAGGRGRKKAD